MQIQDRRLAGRDGCEPNPSQQQMKSAERRGCGGVGSDERRLSITELCRPVQLSTLSDKGRTAGDELLENDPEHTRRQIGSHTGRWEEKKPVR